MNDINKKIQAATEYLSEHAKSAIKQKDNENSNEFIQINYDLMYNLISDKIKSERKLLWIPVVISFIIGLTSIFHNQYLSEKPNKEIEEIKILLKQQQVIQNHQDSFYHAKGHNTNNMDTALIKKRH